MEDTITANCDCGNQNRYDARAMKQGLKEN
jgi:hypothetical protein